MAPTVDEAAARLDQHLLDNYEGLHRDGTPWAEIARRSRAAGANRLAEWADAKDAEAGAGDAAQCTDAAEARAAAAAAGQDVTPDAAKPPTKRAAAAAPAAVEGA